MTSFLTAQQREQHLDKVKLVDLFEAITVEITIDEQNKLWVDVDGKCVLRIGSADRYIVNIDGIRKEYHNTRRHK